MIKLCFHFVAVFLYCIVIAQSGLAIEPTSKSETEPTTKSADEPAPKSVGEPASKSVSTSASKVASEPAPAGVGMLLTSDQPGHFVVQYVLSDMPAAKADVKVGDVVLEVDGVAVDKIKSVEELVDKIRGASGSAVKLKIQSGDKTRDIALVRGTIPTVKPQAADDFKREVSVYFYLYEDLIPNDPLSMAGYHSEIYGDQTVRNFLRGQLHQSVHRPLQYRTFSH